MTRSVSRLLLPAVLVAALFAAPAPAFAQEDPLSACREIAADAERLACYDRVMNVRAGSEADAPQTRAQPPAPVAEAEPMREAPRSAAAPAPQQMPEQAEEQSEEQRGFFALFGAENLRSRKKQEREEQVLSMTASIVDYKLLPYGELVVTLDNGQVWEQLEPSRSITRRVDDDSVKTVIIERAALGSYRMKVMPMDRSMKVNRIE